MSQINTRIVLRNDTKSNWSSVNPELMTGEIGVETDTGLFKIGVSGKNWNALEYANDAKPTNVQVVESYDSLTSTNRVVGDMGIVAAPLYTGATQKTYTAYVWTDLGEGKSPRYNWAAMDGNYSANNVYTSARIKLAGFDEVGNYSKGDEIAAGTSLQSLLSNMLQKVEAPSITSSPYITIGASGSDDTHEVGRTYKKPTGTLTVNSGSYTYGYKKADGSVATDGTGAVFTSAKIAFGADDTTTATNQYVTGSNLSHGGTVSIAPETYAGSTNTMATYTDTQESYIFSGNAEHGDGQPAINSIEEPCADVYVQASTTNLVATDKTVKYRGYRKVFVGYGTDGSENSLSSATIRAFNCLKEKVDNVEENGKKASAVGALTYFSVPDTATRAYIACPTNSAGKKYTLSVAQMNSGGLWDTYTHKFKENVYTVNNVEGYSSAGGVQDYTVYCYKFPSGSTKEFKFTLASANA